MLGHAIDAAVERQRAHLIVLMGEAGVGKSRLAEEAASIARRRHDARVFEGRCVPYGEANVWWPVAEALRQACELRSDDPLAEAERRTTEAVAVALGLDAVGRRGQAGGHRPAVPHGLRGHAPRASSPSAPATRPPVPLLTFLEGSTRQRPVIIVLSDLHWADPLVLELVRRSSTASAGSRSPWSPPPARRWPTGGRRRPGATTP